MFWRRQRPSLCCPEALSGSAFAGSVHCKKWQLFGRPGRTEPSSGKQSLYPSCSLPTCSLLTCSSHMLLFAHLALAQRDGQLDVVKLDCICQRDAKVQPAAMAAAEGGSVGRSSTGEQSSMECRDSAMNTR